MRNSGREAEDMAAAYLQQQGLKLLERNYRCRFGEIDVIPRDRNARVFVEVRMRSSERFGAAGASITRHKRVKLEHAAQHDLCTITRPPACRFDALLIKGSNNSIAWLKNAF